MSGEQQMVAINVLWKVLVGFGVAGLGLASVLYGGQMKLDSDKLDESVFAEYKKDTRQYLVENNDRIRERFDNLDDKVDEGFDDLKRLIEMEYRGENTRRIGNGEN